MKPLELVGAVSTTSKSSAASSACAASLDVNFVQRGLDALGPPPPPPLYDTYAAVTAMTPFDKHES